MACGHSFDGTIPHELLLGLGLKISGGVVFLGTPFLVGVQEFTIPLRIVSSSKDPLAANQKEN